MGYIAPLSPKFMPETVRAFLQQPGYEQVTFGFRELPTRELLDGLKTFLYDVVFCIYEEGEPEVEFVPLLDQELVAIVPPDHPLAAEDQILLSQLAPYPFITYMPHVQIYRDIMAYISQSGWTPQVFCNATGEASISSLVAQRLRSLHRGQNGCAGQQPSEAPSPEGPPLQAHHLYGLSPG